MLFDIFKGKDSNCRKCKTAKPSRALFTVLDEMRNHNLVEVMKSDYGEGKVSPTETVIKVDEVVSKAYHANMVRFADKIEDAVDGKDMRNCDRFDNWKDAMTFFYENECGMDKSDAEDSIGSPSSAFLTWLYSPYTRET